MALDMLLKLVAAFGPTIRSTISAPPAVGVDLHQEERYTLQSLTCQANLLPVSFTRNADCGNYATALISITCQCMLNFV